MYCDVYLTNIFRHCALLPCETVLTQSAVGCMLRYVSEL